MSVCKSEEHEGLLCGIVLGNFSQIDLFNAYTVDYNVHVRNDEGGLYSQLMSLTEGVYGVQGPARIRTWNICMARQRPPRAQNQTSTLGNNLRRISHIWR